MILHPKISTHYLIISKKGFFHLVYVGEICPKKQPTEGSFLTPSSELEYIRTHLNVRNEKSTRWCCRTKNERPQPEIRQNMFGKVWGKLKLKWIYNKTSTITWCGLMTPWNCGAKYTGSSVAGWFLLTWEN